MPNVDPALWCDILAFLRQRHTATCRQWFEELVPLDLDAGLLSVHTPSAVQQHYLQEKCREQFTEAAQAATGQLVAVRFVTGAPRPAHFSGPVTTAALTQEPQASAHGAAPGASARPGSPRQRPAPMSLSSDGGDDLHFDQIVINPDYSFDNFIPGSGNHLAYAAAIAVANQPGVAYNPLFIHGGVGLGKTHLLQAICGKIIEDAPQKRICYLSCDSFMNQFLDCVQKGQMSQFRHRYRHVDVLVIDDIHFLANRERTQEEFFHTFNELYQSNRQIVISSDSPPAEIPQLEERLVSRFQWGLVANVSRPDYETRVAIVRAKAKLRGMEIPDEVVSYIATRIESNARELEGAITTILGHAALQNKPIDLNLARTALGDTGPTANSSQTTLQQIIDAVTTFYNVKLSDLQSKRRHKSITEPRQVCMWLARRKTRFSLEEIGGYFGGRDHTTVMHSIRTVDDRASLESNFAQQLTQLEQNIVRNSAGA